MLTEKQRAAAKAEGYSDAEIAEFESKSAQAPIQQASAPEPQASAPSWIDNKTAETKANYDKNVKAEEYSVGGYNVPKSLALPIGVGALGLAAGYGLSKLRSPNTPPDNPPGGGGGGLTHEQIMQQHAQESARLANEKLALENQALAKKLNPTPAAQTPATPAAPEAVPTPIPVDAAPTPAAAPQSPVEALQAKLADIKGGAAVTPFNSVSGAIQQEALTNAGVPATTAPTPQETQAATQQVAEVSASSPVDVQGNAPDAHAKVTASPVLESKAAAPVVPEATTATTSAATPVPPPETPVTQARQKSTFKDTPETWTKLTKEGTTFLAGYGPGDNNLFNTFGNEGRKAVLEKYNGGKPVGSYDNYLKILEQLKQEPTVSLPKDVRKAIGVPPSEFGNFGPLGKALKVGGIAGLGLAAADLANAAPAQRAQIAGEAATGFLPPQLQALLYSKGAGEGENEDLAFKHRMEEAKKKGAGNRGAAYDPRKLQYLDVGVPPPY